MSPVTDARPVPHYSRETVEKLSSRENDAIACDTHQTGNALSERAKSKPLKTSRLAGQPSFDRIRYAASETFAADSQP